MTHMNLITQQDFNADNITVTGIADANQDQLYGTFDPNLFNSSGGGIANNMLISETQGMPIETQ